MDGYILAKGKQKITLRWPTGVIMQQYETTFFQLETV